MRTATFKLSLGVVVIALAVGCSSVGEGHKGQSKDVNWRARSILCVSSYYSGIFHGDGKRDWSGLLDSSKSLSVLHHHPTKSEFFILVNELPNPDDTVTNNLKSLASQLAAKAHASQESNCWVSLTNEISYHGGPPGPVRSALYFTEFSGKRLDTDLYSKNDDVVIEIFMIPFSAEIAGHDRVVSLTAVGMIPVNVPPPERDRLTAILSDFLKRMTLFHS